MTILKAHFESQRFPFLNDAVAQPRYMALFRAFQQAILQGDLVTSAKLPASRTLAKNLGISRITPGNSGNKACWQPVEN